MKSFKTYIQSQLYDLSSMKESLLDDEDEIASNDDALIKTFIEENYDLHWSTGEGIIIRQDKKLGTIVDFDGFIVLKNNKIKSLTNGLFKFGKCIDFDCASCEGIKDLEGAPQECSQLFNCSYCKNLKSLKGAPRKCKHFNCSTCFGIESLEGGPKFVKGDYICDRCSLKNLIGAPKKVSTFDCSSNTLKTIIGAPQDCKDFKCDRNRWLESLEGAPQLVSGEFNCNNCDNLTSLEGAPKECKEFICAECNELKNLIGAPQKCSRFECSYCESLESLEGSPRECKEFRCHMCRKLKTFDGMPDDITDVFNIRGCKELLHSNLPLPHKITGKIYK